MTWRRWIPLAVLFSLVQCRRSSSPSLAPATPEEAFAVLRDAARRADAELLFDLLDLESHWSLMSIHKDQQTICSLVRSHYPKDRRARELERCHLAEGAKDARAFFASYARVERLLEPLHRLGPGKAARQAGDRVEIESQGQRMPFCREKKTWSYCGLRARLEDLKIKQSRDLATVQENAESFGGR